MVRVIMPRNYRFLLKWIVLAGASAVLFKLSCDRLVQTFLSTSSSSTIKAGIKDAMSRYEDSLIAWAQHGHHAKPDASPRETREARSDLQLIGAQVFFRHGARTPITLLPTLEEVIYAKEHLELYPPTKWDIKLIAKRGSEVVSKEKISSATDLGTDGMRKLKSATGDGVVIGQLTAVGQKQLYQLGRRLRSELIGDNGQGLIPAEYDPSYVYCRSTYMNRTLASARSFLAGLFSAENQVQAKGPFEIEVHHFPDEDMFPNPKIAPILKKCLGVGTFYNSLKGDHDLKRARHALLTHIGHHDEKFGIAELHDDIVSRLAHNFSVSKELLELTKQFEIMSAREYVYRATSIGFDAFIRYGCGPLLYLMRENFKSILAHYLDEKSNKSKKPYQRLFIYSGHDTTVIPLSMAFEIFGLRWPKYATYIFIKYFISTTNPNETYVALDFAGERQILPNCADYYCPYSTFLKNLEGRFERPKYIQ